MRKAILIVATIALTTASCKHENIDDRMEREARDYTEKYCPTPEDNGSRVDSMVYDRKNRTLINYCTVSGRIDNKEIMEANERALSEGIASEVKNDPKCRAYRNDGIAIRYILRSSADPNTVWLDTTVK